MSELTQLKPLKKVNMCKRLAKLIYENNHDSVANLNLLYTVNRENFIHFLRSGNNPQETHKCSENIAVAVVYLVKNEKDFLKNSIEFFVNEYEIDFHSLHVALYAVSIGNLLKFEEEKLIQLALAALYMDIGLKIVNDKITDETLSINELKAEHLQLHPQYSVNLLTHNYIHSPYVLQVLFEHRWKFDILEE